MHKNRCGCKTVGDVRIFYVGGERYLAYNMGHLLSKIGFDPFKPLCAWRDLNSLLAILGIAAHPYEHQAHEWLIDLLRS